MSGAVGSLAWMSPEVYKGEPYNEKADVYSFAIILWELWSMNNPYGGLTPDLFASLAAHDNKRPSLSQYNIPNEWRILITNSWHPSSLSRPSFGQILTYLETQCTVN
eukprot:TRINITY_DN2199_c0_g1_i2.p2 TRINITY_DN2199_c0_g1~~TRINITY_DN2199_c0_g1_i2.p2  ORF type:complete len:107 (+),score=17.09 TRINITY_DN2199_c0_g1_i2:339-659(+)